MNPRLAADFRPVRNGLLLFNWSLLLGIVILVLAGLQLMLAWREATNLATFQQLEITKEGRLVRKPVFSAPGFGTHTVLAFGQIVANLFGNILFLAGCFLCLETPRYSAGLWAIRVCMVFASIGFTLELAFNFLPELFVKPVILVSAVGMALGCQLVILTTFFSYLGALAMYLDNIPLWRECIRCVLLMLLSPLAIAAVVACVVAQWIPIVVALALGGLLAAALLGWPILIIHRLNESIGQHVGEA